MVPRGVSQEWIHAKAEGDFFTSDVTIFASHYFFMAEYITIVDVSYYTTLPHSTNVFWQEENIQVMLPHAWREIKLYTASKENQSGFLLFHLDAYKSSSRCRFKLSIFLAK